MPTLLLTELATIVNAIKGQDKNIIFSKDRINIIDYVKNIKKERF